VHGSAIVINGDGGQTRDYVHVHDVVRANLAAVDGPAGVYNIGTGVETDVNTLYRMLAEAAGVDAAAEHGPAKPGEQRRSCLDTTAAREHLGWNATVSFADGVRSTVEYFRTAG
jgi:UDP-glucose 4-epimerase